MDVFAERTVGKVRKLLGKRDRDKELRESCDEVLSHLKAGSPNLPEETYVQPLFLAIISKQTKVTCLAMDCLEKMMAFGYLKGDQPISTGLQDRLQRALHLTDETMNTTSTGRVLLIDAVIEVICSCNDHPENDVQLQVLKAVLTAVASPTCEVHEHSLLKAIRAGYHIYLVSKSMINQTVAKGTLQRMVTTVFQRMETAASAEVAMTPSRSLSKLAHGHTALYPSVQAAFGFKYNSRTLQSSKTLGEDHAVLFPTVLHKDAYLVFRAVCRISMRFVVEDAVGSATSTQPSAGAPAISVRALTNAVDDPFAMQSKMISLELLLGVINHAGPTFRSHERFLVAIRSYLCVSLLQNCTSIYTQVVELSLRVFVVLITHFKAHLKGEIEVFITNIFLGILDSENSTYEHKMLVLEVLNHICDDQQILSEIFLNYDCDWESIDLFKRIVHALAKVTKLTKKETPTTNVRQLKLQQQEAALVLKGLECLAAIVHSLKKAANFISEAAPVRASACAPDDNSDTEDTTEDVATPTCRTSAVVEVFDKKKKRQDLLSTGIVKFNVKATDGIKFCMAHDLIPKGDARGVAQFFHDYNSRLDKFQLGEYLGKEAQYQNGFCVKVLHEFVDQMDFHDLSIDDAIRKYLAAFRLPGEAQKIDRMMEKFAERYHLNNAGVFPSADTAFVLSFSIILLQTDLHNPSIPEEKKMTREGFARNNRGINNGEDLPADYLGGIYDRIKSLPISIKDDDDRAKLKRESSSSFPLSASVLDKQRREAFGKEREAMVKASEAFFKRKVAPAASPVADDEAKSFHVVRDDRNNAYIRPMFEIVWAPLLACCSVLFETLDQPVAIQYCLDGFKHAIHLAARLAMSSERDAFVSILANFTAVQHSATREIRGKHIEAMKTLIAIAVKEGNFLGDSWRDVLQALSHLARLQLHAQGLQSDTQFFSAPSPVIPAPVPSKRLSSFQSATLLLNNPFTPSNGALSFGGTSPKPFKPPVPPTEESTVATEARNAQRLLDQVDGLASDRVFASSVQLSDAAVQEFVLALCVVSLSECQGLAAVGISVRGAPLSLPRVFSLQKLVEVADMNMHVRSRVVWANMWNVLSRHFTAIGCHDNLGLAMYAIDSLKQLSMKFLEKDELRDFNFQRLFLTPFQIIISNAMATEIRELVLGCVQNMILGRVEHIKSGWKTIWGVLRVAAESYDRAEESEDRVVLVGFAIAKMIVETHFDRVVAVFQDVLDALLLFASVGNDAPDAERPALAAMCRSAVALMGTCLGHVATGRVIESLDAGVLSPRAAKPDVEYTDQTQHTHVWLPALHPLFVLASDARQDMRHTALDTLYGSLHTHGHVIGASLWHVIFKSILLPLMEHIRRVETRSPAVFNRKSSKKALLALVHLYGTYFKVVADVPDIVNLLARWLTDEPEEQLACAAAIALEHLLVRHGHQFDADLWESLAFTLVSIAAHLLPRGLFRPLEAAPAASLAMYPAVRAALFPTTWTIAAAPSLTHMLVLLELQRILGSVLVKISSLPPSCFTALLACLQDTLAVARRLNDDVEVRQALFDLGWRYGCLGAGELPHMLQQEVLGTREYLKVVVHNLEAMRSEFTALVHRCLDEYLSWGLDKPEPTWLSTDRRQRAAGYIPLVVDILHVVAAFSQDEVLRHLEWLYPQLIALVNASSIDVRRALHVVLSTSICQLLPLPKP
ncbi:brefeldin A-inhibited guanine nucleotide-exchange protein [Achlya hypogyna]|uniref:Brefeldin A-inhibited guanine nucleotide-exchange protein n=1 Tax=Achlya hypogyna TaxID=1202772 RepID=A0A1V9YDK8_ACHHY|nr:brefeldin A-inhibited guanine nucleotide-exchange protein [Achlya hypogyna]